MRSKPLRHGLLALLTIALLGAAAIVPPEKQVGGAPPAPTPPSPPSQTGPAEDESPDTLADRLLRDAASAADAALAWFERKTGLSGGDVAERAAEAERSLRSAIADAVERAGEGREPGVRLYRAGARAGEALWELIDDGDEAAPALPRRMVLLIHGMDEPGGIWDDLAPALARAGHEVARFDYPNDQGLVDSAELLTGALVDLRARGVREVSIVAHSAGGLIARDVLTRDAPAMYRGEPRGHERLPDVRRLIMVGTPNRGAALAHVRVLAEARELLARWISSDGKDAAALLGFLHDGDGEIANDLLPDSAYLTDLNARPLPRTGEDGVEITVIVGAVAQEASESLRGVLSWRIVRETLGDERLRAAEAAIRDLSGTVGDGIVPVESQMLDGAADVVRVEANHRSMLRRLEVGRLRFPESDPPAIAVILDRLSGDRLSGDRLSGERLSGERPEGER